MTGKREKFCQKYAETLNGRLSGLFAGFSENGIDQTVSALLKVPKVRQRIDELRAPILYQSSIDGSYIINGLKEVAERCMQRVPVMFFNHITKEMEQETDEEGNGVWKFDSQGANRALELLGKHVGIFEKDNNQKRPLIQVNIDAS